MLLRSTRKVDETHNGRIIGNVGSSEVPMAWIPIVLLSKGGSHGGYHQFTAWR